MRRAADFFSEDDRNRINQAVAQAESRTSAEIVPVVATSSGRYDRPEDIVGVWLGLIALTTVWLLLPKQSAEPGSWGGLPAGLELAVLLAAVLIGFVAGAALASRTAWLRRLFTPTGQMHEEVFARAREAFFDNRVHHTAGGSGLLIYVSFFERTAAILGDQAVLDKLGQAVLDELCEQLTAKLAMQAPTDALCDILGAAGERLATVLPRDADDVNELPDTLVVLEE